MQYTFKQPAKRKSLWEQIQFQFRKLKRKFKRGVMTALGVVTTLMALFGGHLFTAIVVGGLTYFFWKRKDGLDELVGKEKVEAAF